MGDPCLPWNVCSGRRLLPDVCGCCVSCAMSAEVARSGTPAFHGMSTQTGVSCLMSAAVVSLGLHQLL